ncbi:Uncharacterized [Moorella glycerini]|uniref:Uncharacterized protein n=1 Tax=Neomoorella stamsii TaxID=1266720 RepID=A0A9X7P6I6_9FIRM|nr:MULTISPECIES: hypothetical protein [Moorella]PRR73419.1 hypothetical protein MOST_12670 [Moorella stamsii]CEP69188.1 Uncharacterized [Moorella glycerini]
MSTGKPEFEEKSLTHVSVAGKPEFEEKSLSHVRIGWVIWCCILVLSGFIVPFTLLSDVASAAGTFLYWAVYAIVAIISIFTMTRSWRD